ncbi:choice-of-anchor G family protein [Cellulosimicrobium funkei]|nr:choice-of-anchor G family protein [Cellulosimicrobium funkei]
MAVIAAPVGAVHAAPTDDSEARARVIDSSLFTSELAAVGHSESGNPSDPGPNTGTVDASLLGALQLDLGALQLPVVGTAGSAGLLEIGDLGLLNSYSSSPSASSSTASSGVIGENGAVNLDAANAAGPAANTTVNLTDLLDQLQVAGLTDQIVQEISLELGAVASTATQTAPGAATTDYVVTDGNLVIDSPLVGALSADLQTTVTGAGGIADDLVGSEGLIGSTVEGLATEINIPLVASLDLTGGTAGVNGLDAALAEASATLLAEPLQDAEGLVSVNLADGTIQVDVAQLAGGTEGGLNGLAPNTQVLTADTIGLITDALAEALGSVDEQVNETVTEVLNATEVDIALPVELTLLGGVVDAADGQVLVNGTLGQLAGTTEGQPDITLDLDLLGLPLGTVLDPVVDFLDDALLAPLAAGLGPILTAGAGEVSGAVTGLVDPVLETVDPVLTEVLDEIVDVTINEQPEPGLLGAESTTVNAVSLELLPGAQAVDLNLASSTVRAAQIDPALTVMPGTVVPGDEATVNGSDYPPNAEVDVQLLDPAGEPVPGTATTVTTDENGDFTTTITVPEGTEPGAFEVEGVSGDVSETAPLTVEDAVEAGPAELTATPGIVAPGDEVTVDGSGYPENAEVDVQLLDPAGAPIPGTETTVTTDENGDFTTTITVPEGTEPGAFEVEGVSGEVSETAPLEVQDAVEVGPAELSVSPGTVVPGEDVTVDGSGYPENAEVDVQLLDPAGEPVPGTETTVTTDENGDFTTTITVPEGAEPGAFEVEGVSGDVAETAPLTVEDAVEAGPADLSVAPGTVAPGEEVTVDGSGYPENAEVDVQLLDPAGEPVPGTETTVTTDENGDFTTTITVPEGTEPGAFEVEGVSGDVAESAPLTVEDAVEAGPAELAVSPGTVVPGEDVTVDGSGYPPNAEVDVQLLDPAGAPVPGTETTVTSDENGDFTTTITVPEGTEPGAFEVEGVSGDVAETAPLTVESADEAGPADLSVAPGTVAPGEDVTVDGSGYPENAAVDVQLLDPAGVPVPGTETTVTSDGNGDFTTTITVPEGTEPGAFEVEGVSGEVSETAPLTVEDAVEAGPADLSVAPGTVAPGEEVTVDGSGYPENAEVDVQLLDPAGEPVPGTETTVTTDENGDFTTTITVPEGTEPGAFEVEGVSGDVAESAPLTVEDAVEAGPAELAVSPGTVVPGEDVTVDGSGYPPNAEVDVQLLDPAGAPVPGTETTVTSDENGDFTTTITVPEGTEPGAFEVEGVSGDVAETAPLTVESADEAGPADLSVAPGTVAPGEDVTVDGSGYPENAAVDVQLLDPAGVPVPGTETTVTSDGNGDFTTTITVPEGTEPGAFEVEGVSGEVSETAPLTVEDAVEAGPADLSVSPGTVAPGEDVTVDGSGYPENAEVDVQLLDPAGEPVPGTETTVTTDENGDFTTTITVPEGTEPGDYDVVAEAGDVTETAPLEVQDAAEAGPADLSVSPGTVAPGEDVTVDGSGYPENAEVDVQLLDPAGEVVPGTETTVTTDENGDFTTTITVPEGTEPGDYDVVAEGGDVSETAPLEVQDAAEAGPADLSVSPGTVESGDEVTVDGSGFPPNTEVEVQLLDPEGNLVPGTETTVTTDENGDFTTTITVPEGTEPGDYDVVAEAGDVTETAPLEVQDAAEIGPAELSVSPGTVTPGEDVTVDGSGYPPNAEVEVHLLDPAGEVVPGTETTVTTDENGDFTTTITVPEGTEPGDYDVEAISGGMQETAPLTVEDADQAGPADLSVSPGTVAPGDEVTVDGSGFPPNTEVEVQLLDPEGNPVPGTETTVTTDENGDFTTTITVPEGTEPGDYDLVAEAGDVTETAPLEVEAPDAGTTPELSVSPGAVEPGEEVTVDGSGYPPNTEVEVQLLDPEGNPVPGTETTVTTDENGDFTTTITIPEGTEPGTYEVEAVTGEDSEVVQLEVREAVQGDDDPNGDAGDTPGGSPNDPGNNNGNTNPGNNNAGNNNNWNGTSDRPGGDQLARTGADHGWLIGGGLLLLLLGGGLMLMERTMRRTS